MEVTKELIGVQIEQAAEILCLAQKSEWEAQALRGLVACCERLLQIAQNQQVLIDSLREEFDHATGVVQEHLEWRHMR